MSEKERNKAGLHKKISSIFDGIPIPRPNGDKKPSDASTQDNIEIKESGQQIPESAKAGLPKPYHAAKISPETDPTQQSKVITVQESEDELAPRSEDKPAFSINEETAEESKSTSVQEFDSEPTLENKEKPVFSKKEETLEEAKSEPTPEDKPVFPIREDKPEEPKNELSSEDKDKLFFPKKGETPEESKNELASETKDKVGSSPKLVASKESEVKLASENENKPFSRPKFLTAEESKVIPIEESEIEQAPEKKDKSVSPPKMVTARKPKVIPVHESEFKPVQKSESTQANSPKLATAEKSKVKEIKKPKVILVKTSKAYSGKVIEKRSAVKNGKQGFLQQIAEKLLTPKPGVSPTKQKVTIIMVPILFIFLIIFLLKGGVFGTGAHIVDPGIQNEDSGVVSAVANNQIDWKIPEPYPTTLRDPMQLGPVKIETDQAESGNLIKLSVKSILYSEDGSSAVIDNRIVHEGERVRGAKVMKINKDTVEFEMNGKTWTQEVKG
jgi:outer membrane biosynthesis protein TonB